MATYSELHSLPTDAGFDAFYGKIRVAAVIKATAIIDLATPTAAQLDWAKAAINSPDDAAQSVIWYVVGSNNGATINQILTASDTAVQTNVDAAVDALTGA